jgi:hypothetical protein
VEGNEWNRAHDGSTTFTSIQEEDNSDLTRYGRASSQSSSSAGR